MNLYLQVGVSSKHDHCFTEGGDQEQGRELVVAI